MSICSVRVSTSLTESTEITVISALAAEAPGDWTPAGAHLRTCYQTSASTRWEVTSDFLAHNSAIVLFPEALQGDLLSVTGARARTRSSPGGTVGLLHQLHTRLC